MEDEAEKSQHWGWNDNRGVGVVEIILILVVLIALVAIFKSQLTSLVNDIFSTITKNAGSVMK
ncbi:MAG: Flp1 family type IVb pilin [Clostridiales bacterium]|nr:Flp1 family type IVb pilin [Clostridiales bacterium]